MCKQLDVVSGKGLEKDHSAGRAWAINPGIDFVEVIRWVFNQRPKKFQVSFLLFLAFGPLFLEFLDWGLGSHCDSHLGDLLAKLRANWTREFLSPSWGPKAKTYWELLSIPQDPFLVR